MNHLLRDLAPMTEAAWSAVDDEARRSLESFLAARRIVDFVGPRGWAHSAESVGRVEPVPEPITESVQSRIRQVQPLVELRTEFRVERAELEAIDRGGAAPELAPVVEAARRLAHAEDHAVFNGYAGAGIRGISEASPHDPLPIPNDYGAYPGTVALAVELLHQAGVDGPYAIALGPQCFTGVIETTEYGGYPVLEHLRLIAGGPVVRASTVDGALVLSQRGGDFELICGQDASVGYLDHGDTWVSLYLEESVTARVLAPEAAVVLSYQ